MNILAKTSLLALASLALVSQSAKADLNYTSGDILLGFRISNSTEEVVFDLGKFSTNFGSSFTVDLSADLTAAFGNWSSLKTISWGAVGYVNGGSVFASKAETTVGTTVVGYTNLSNANATKVSNSVIDLNNNLATNGDTATTYANGEITAPTDTTSAYWTNEAKGTYTGLSGLSFGVFNSAVFEANNGATSTLSNTALDLFTLDRTGAGTGTLDGTFTLSSDGVLSYQAVPEPSTYAMMAFGGLGLLRMFRRRSIKA